MEENPYESPKSEPAKHERGHSRRVSWKSLSLIFLFIGIAFGFAKRGSLEGVLGLSITAMAAVTVAGLLFKEEWPP